MSGRSEEDLAGKVLHWYQANQRDLPWRRRTDPYAIWVSEIMLQQTRVETVLPYYERFLARFPSLEALAAAESDEVLAAWSGLGYYRRARHLHRAAQKIVTAGRGFPRQIEELRNLPGVGEYTAAAVGSIAFGIAEPAVDGNIERLIGRYLGIEGDPKRGEARRRIREVARSLLSKSRPGDSNQAMMELGATICRPVDPLCAECPMAQGCEARHSGRPTEFPMRRSRVAPTRVFRRVVLVQEGEKLLLFRRPEDDAQLAGMWELPWTDVRSGAEEARCDLARRYGGSWRLLCVRGRVRHAITDRAFDIEVLAGELESDSRLAEGIEAGWFGSGEIVDLAISSQVKKALAADERSKSAALASREQIPAE
jgi:A/G-specific adenine glycosylase